MTATTIDQGARAFWIADTSRVFAAALIATPLKLPLQRALSLAEELAHDLEERGLAPWLRPKPERVDPVTLRRINDVDVAF